ncbi:MAG: tetratricopeptide repeat protein [Acidobacteriia bacterium]|nr:tetratricopeptide repeat protein [Terriglobia bacterium]
MTSLRFIAGLLFCSAAAVAQGTAPIGQTVLVVPFENQSKAPGLSWISDSFPELLQERLDSPSLYVLSREDRLRAYDRLGIPVELHPSRATIYRIAEQLDVDYVVLGQYNFDGRLFTATAQLLDMRRARLLPSATESAPLVQLIDVETALSWDLLHSFSPDFARSRDTYLAQAPTIRLDAFEHYIKGVLAPTAEAQIQQLREAVRLNPVYSEALLRLGKAYYRERQYDQALSSLSSLSPDDPHASEANFYVGLAAYNKDDFQRAESAFGLVAARLPLTEVYNNLGVVADHHDRKAAVDYFQKAIALDPNDADYHFNLAIALYRSGDVGGATRQLQAALSLNPNDSEAKGFLSTISSGNSTGDLRGVVPASMKVPVQRLRTNYDESSFRQLSLKLTAAAEQRLAKADSRAHAQFHADRGHQLLNQGFVSEAEREFREAITLDPSNADAHSGLAGVLEAGGNANAARSEAEQALRLRQFAEPLLVLTRLSLRENRVEAAAEDVDQALRLEPNNAAAQALKRSVAAKLAQEAQPLPNR